MYPNNGQYPSMPQSYPNQMPQNYPNQMPQQYQPNQYPSISQQQPNQYPQSQPGHYATMPQQPGQCPPVQISQISGSYPQNQQNYCPSVPQQPQPGFVMSPTASIIGMPSAPAMPQGYHNISGAPGGVILNAFPNSQQVGPGYGQQMHFHQGRPTVVPAPNFNPMIDAAVLRKAMKGIGTDEDALIGVLCHRSNWQRVEIARAFKQAHGRDLLDDVKSETSGNFGRTLCALLLDTKEFYARELQNALYGAGTDEDALIEIVCTLPNYEILSIGCVYQLIFGKNLEKDLRDDTSGNLKRLMTALVNGRRDESMMTDINAAIMDAKALKKAGIDKWGTDESVFIQILCTRNYAQIGLIAQEYTTITGHALGQDIRKEFSGRIEEGLLAILGTAMNPSAFFAERLHKSMAGLGTNDSSLIRLMVTRCEIDMVDIKDEFLKKYNKTLKSFIQGDTSGHYRNALNALAGENRS